MKHLLGKKLFINDLEDIDPDEAKNLKFILDECSNAEDLCLNFTYYKENLGIKEEIELIPNGFNIEVTN